LEQFKTLPIILISWDFTPGAENSKITSVPKLCYNPKEK
jgi:hypothetical protein